ncbi:MAG: TonB-dependent receptor [Balneolales bacterium]|nr:TonB-dependent receptor [Balneolales bacterium]
MNNVTKLFFTLFVLFFAAEAAHAQAGRITGTVTDARDGEPIIGAQVIIQGTTQGTTTDFDGNYRILNVRPGTYTLEFRYIGYATQIVEDVLVRTDLNTEINMQMRESVLEGDEVVVRATRDVVIRDLTSSESRVSREDIERLPVQELNDIVQLQAGVTVGPGGSIHIRGGRASEVAYVVDGVRVSDDFDRGQGLRVDNNAIEEIQVISGAFNAEYGQATSGIINIATRSGTNTLRGDVRIWGGEYATTRTGLYPGAPTEVGGVDPFHQYNIEASVSGPIIRDKLTFFASARRFRNEGWLYGYNAFSPQGPIGPRIDDAGNIIWERGFSEVSASNPVNRFGQTINPDDPWITILENDGDFIRYFDSGVRDSSLVSMNPFESISFQGNLQWNVTNMVRFNFIGNASQEHSRLGYNHGNRLVATNNPENERNSYYLNWRTTITPTPNMFFTTNVAMRFNKFENSLYGNPYDPRYLNFENAGDFPQSFQSQEGRFNRFGTSNNFFSRSTRTFIGKIEYNHQVNDQHFLKGGIDIQADILNFRNFGLVPLSSSGEIQLPDDLPAELRDGPLALQLGVPVENTIGHEVWTRKPFTVSAYLQDRIDYENLTINVGLRFDYFQPNGRIPASDRPRLTQRFDERDDSFWTESSPKYQLSPRLGIAYPISSNGVIHFSYGYFFQIPDYERLYRGSNLILQSVSGAQGVFGNPDLKPEQSVKYELGLQQEIFPGTALDVSIFYEDKRDYVSSGPINQTAVSSVRYGTWINRDYANIRGITAAINQRVSRRVSFGLDYTFSIAEDSNSDPAAEFFAAVASGDTTGSNLARFLTPANWDRTHVLNTSFFYARDTWGFNVVQRFSSGLPYTPSASIPRNVGITATRDIITNSLRMPAFFTLDLNMYKNITVAGNTLGVFFNVYNLLDNRNPSSVFTDTGSPNLPFNPIAGADPGFYADPGRFGEPRRVQFGFNMSF